MYSVLTGYALTKYTDQRDQKSCAALPDVTKILILLRGTIFWFYKLYMLCVLYVLLRRNK